MGSPVEAGISLDRIHRTQIAWSLIILMAVISAVGIGIHGLIGNEQTGSDDFALYSIIGFIMMIIVYRLDYSFLATYARVIAGIFLGIGTQVINGKIFYFAMGNLHVSIFSFMLLYVPLYGAILYQYYGRGSMGVIKGIIWMLVPVVIALRLPSLSLAIILFVSMGLVLSFAVWKGWFQISKKYFYLIFFGVSVALPVILLAINLGFHLLAAYQEARIQAYMGSGEGNYITNLLHGYLANSQLIGGNSQDIMNKLPDFNTSYIMIGMIMSIYRYKNIFSIHIKSRWKKLA